MKRYDTYKDSGVQWLGEIPGHWDCVPFKSVFDLGKGLSITKENLKDSGINVISYGQIHSKNNKFSYVIPELYRYVDESYLITNPQSLANKEDFLFADTSEDVEGSGNFVRIDNEETIFAGYHTIIAKNKKSQSGNYLAYLLQSNKWKMQIWVQVHGIKVFSITRSILNSTKLLLPPLSEQHSIVTYLDDKCGKIDKMVEGKQKQIELLAEMKQRIIADAVTRGLNPDVKMKATNIPWLPEIPEHWEMKRLKYLVSCNDESLTNTEDPNLEINYVEIGDVNDVKGITNMTKYRFEDAPSRARRKTRKDDVIVSTVRTYLKAIAKIPENEIIVSTGFAVLRAKDINSSYLAFCCMSNKFVDSVVAKSKGISYPAITAFELLNLYVPVPPLSEQHSIVSYITDKTTKIGTLTSNLQQEIESIKEYKQRLISDVVTGQIKVC